MSNSIASLPASADVASAAGGPKTILVADDNTAIAEATKLVLGHHGYRVVTAADGAAALSTVRARPHGFDLVVTDIDMPELDGIGLARALATLRPDLKVIAMSGRRLGTSIASVFSGEVLEKPFAVDALLGRVRQALASGRPPVHDALM